MPDNSFYVQKILTERRYIITGLTIVPSFQRIFDLTTCQRGNAIKEDRWLTGVAIG
jgi:hypothetical protein